MIFCLVVLSKDFAIFNVIIFGHWIQIMPREKNKSLLGDEEFGQSFASNIFRNEIRFI